MYQVEVKAMRRLWKKNWFKNLCIYAATFAAIVALAVATPQKQKNAAADDNTMQIGALKEGESYSVQEKTISLAESDMVQIDDEQLNSGYDEYVAAKWVEGKIVPMTSLEIEKFEEQLYSCKTKKEYKSVMENIAYYNKVIDMKKFDWYLNELEDN